jgi:hypothetical protein
MKNTLILTAALALASTALAVDPTRPMVTGRGNVATAPTKVIVTNQTVEKADETMKLDKFVVTGSLISPAKKSPGRR